MGLKDGLLEVTYELGAGDVVFTTDSSIIVNDGTWHSVLITR